MSGLRAGQSMTSTFCWSKKAAVPHAVWGGALSWTYTKLRPNTPITHGNIWSLRIWIYRCRFMAPSTTTSSLLPPWWIAPHTMTDGPRFPSLGWTQASISLSPFLSHTQTQPSLWYWQNRNSSLKIKCLHCLRSHTLCLLPQSRRRHLCSKVSLGHLAGRWDQYPAARNCLRMVRTDIRLPNRRIICIRRWGAEMKQFILTIRNSWGSSRGMEILIETPRFLWRGWPVSWLHLKILLMHPWDTPSILVTCHLPTTWQFAAIFALASFVAWSPLKVQRNINSLYWNPTLHKSIKVGMARQTSLQVLPLNTLISFSCVSVVPRQYWLCLAIQFGYVMDRWNQQYFIPQLSMPPETINTDQVHANAASVPFQYMKLSLLIVISPLIVMLSDNFGNCVNDFLKMGMGM